MNINDDKIQNALLIPIEIALELAYSPVTMIKYFLNTKIYWQFVNSHIIETIRKFVQNIYEDTIENDPELDKIKTLLSKNIMAIHIEANRFFIRNFSTKDNYKLYYKVIFPDYPLTQEINYSTLPIKDVNAYVATYINPAFFGESSYCSRSWLTYKNPDMLMKDNKKISVFSGLFDTILTEERFYRTYGLYPQHINVDLAYCFGEKKINPEEIISFCAFKSSTLIDDINISNLLYLKAEPFIAYIIKTIKVSPGECLYFLQQTILPLIQTYNTLVGETIAEHPHLDNKKITKEFEKKINKFLCSPKFLDIFQQQAVLLHKALEAEETKERKRK